MKLLLLLVVLVVACFTVSPVMAENLLKNGGFEEGEWSLYATPEHWNKMGEPNNTLYWMNNYEDPHAQEGSKSMFWYGNCNQIVYQFIDFFGGHDGSLSYYNVTIDGWLWIGRCNWPSPDTQLDVGVVVVDEDSDCYGETILQYPIEYTLPLRDWIHLSVSTQMEAYGPIEQIAFYINAYGNPYLCTDNWNLEISPVPEPSSLLVLVAGITTLTCLKRRSSK